MKGPALIPFLWTAAGVAVAVILPILAAIVRAGPPKLAAAVPSPWLRYILAVAAFSLLAAVVCVAGYMQANPGKSIDWLTAFLLGFSWQSAIEQVSGQKKQMLAAQAAPARSRQLLAVAAAIAAVAIAVWSASG